MLSPKRGQKFGKWELKKILGEGGNGVVWHAKNSQTNEDAAIKLLTKLNGRNQEKVYARFQSEVSVINENKDIDGILPILDWYLPKNIKDEIAWYVMPIAQSVEKYLNDKHWEISVKLILDIANTLVKLHEKGISHRDIKPANLLVKDDKFYLSDFGLVDYPDKLDLTSDGEAIGAKWTIAPEMRRASNNADGKAADVYSLAKTLWIFLTTIKDGFDGQYDANSINGLSRFQLTEPEEDGISYAFSRYIYFQPLDELLKECTNQDPLQRLNIKEFVERLNSWTKIYKDHLERNRMQWQDVHNKIFPTAIPQRAIWENIDDIINILDYLGSIKTLNHMFFPGGGGQDMDGARRGKEAGTIELIIDDNDVCLVKPKRLIFESFNFDWEWNYFRLEIDSLRPIESINIYDGYQSLVEIAPEIYISKIDWDNDEDNKYSSDSRHVSRYINTAAFVIFQKTSTYNKIKYTYDGHHNQLGSDEFREYIADKVNYVKHIIQDEVLEQKIIEKGGTIKDFVFFHVDKIFRKDWLKRHEKESIIS